VTRFGGLRWRLLIAFVVTSAVTLLAAAAALLSPLQDRLRAQSQSALKAATLSARGQVQEALHDDPEAVGKAYEVVDDLQRRTNARVGLYVLDPQLKTLYGLPTRSATPSSRRRAPGRGSPSPCPPRARPGSTCSPPASPTPTCRRRWRRSATRS
jgi:hypothetical protein